MKPRGTVRYNTNLIRTMRMEERKSEQLQRLTAILATGSFALLALAVIYGALNFWSMRTVIQVETENLTRLKTEFKKYQAARETIDKDDVELLNGLQIGGIFWSKKLAALGQHLPEGYLLRSIAYKGAVLQVAGWAQASPRQDDLVALQAYLQELGNDAVFSEHFSNIRLTSVTRLKESEASLPGLAFEFIADGPKGKKP